VVARVTVIGDLLEDVVVWTGATVRIGTDNPASITRTRGGSAANVAVAAARAGAAARFIGRIGRDDTGSRLEAALVAEGVDTRLQRGARTGCVVVLVGADGERTMFPDRAAAAELDAVAAQDLDGTTVLHLPLYGFVDPAPARHLTAAAARARADGAAVTIDLSASSVVDTLGPDAVRALIEELRPAVVFANRDEAAAASLTTMEPPDHGCFVVKAGGGPATIVHAGGRRDTVTPPPVATVRDTTGAGDAFAGTFIARWAAGAAPSDACAAAHRAAAATLGTAGATTTRGALP
jgi:sugar/nucleoside kinase (ribokinase family)